jgi:hypothetical protein
MHHSILVSVAITAGVINEMYPIGLPCRFEQILCSQSIIQKAALSIVWIVMIWWNVSAQVAHYIHTCENLWILGAGQITLVNGQVVIWREGS